MTKTTQRNVLLREQYECIYIRWAETIDKVQVQVFVDWMNGRLTTLQTENEW